MKIILSKQFIIDFEKDFKKYDINHLDLVKKLKEAELIYLKNPFIKIKMYLNSISIRGICVINDKNKLISIFFTLKKDKKYGENLILNKDILNKINKLLLKISKRFG